MSDQVTKPPKLPRIDLPRAHVRRMFINADSEDSKVWTPSNAQIVGDLLGEDGVFVSGAPYRKGGKKHLITTMAMRLESSGPDWIRVFYDATAYAENVQIPTEDKKEDVFLAHVLRLDGTFPFSCNIEFVYPEVDSSDLWFPLPSRIGGGADSTETFEIIGVTAKRLPAENEEESEYNFNLSITPGGDAFLDLYFTYNGRFAQDLPTQVLREGSSIASRLVGARAVKTRRSK